MGLTNTPSLRHSLDTMDWRLIAILQNGLPYSTTPYRDIAGDLGISESEVIKRIRAMQDNGLIKRFGVVVRHHELGYRANAMVVWNIPDDHVRDFARTLASSEHVNLCYSRPRRLPQWPYNLFCMVHGHDRDTVIDQVKQLADLYCHGTPEYSILFSKRRFKQRGMRYVDHKPARKVAGDVVHG